MSMVGLRKPNALLARLLRRRATPPTPIIFGPPILPPPEVLISGVAAADIWNGANRRLLSPLTVLIEENSKKKIANWNPNRTGNVKNVGLFC